MRHPTAIVSIALLTGSVLTGCMSIRTRTPEGGDVTMNEREFATYVEHVFRHHNRVLDELITSEQTALANGDVDAEELEEAEADMIRTCDPLNEVIAAEAEQHHASFSTLMKLADVVPECESMTRELEALLHPAPATLGAPRLNSGGAGTSGTGEGPASDTAP
ncbi:MULTISPECIES: hypothetical protein [Methylococcus]|uniref:hypothetical protein n=1 Tax=Methylococcus TaxID=413 RepID=UPI002017F130|nr:hypothetical protein [Methylococcus capsulatus]UQN12276.1 hypothetical protein M3M30_00010 [Methylococcus capsulatus]